MALRTKFYHFKTSEHFIREIEKNSKKTGEEALKANDNGCYYAICFIDDTKQIYTHGVIYHCDQYNDSSLWESIEDINDTLNLKADKNDFDLLEAEVAENELVTAKALTDLNNNKADRGDIPDVSKFMTSSDLAVIEAKFYDYLPLTGGSLSGEVSAPDFVTTSDERLKTFTEDVEVDFNQLKAIPKKYYYWNDQSMGEELQIGTSAQELMKIYPECVHYDEINDRYSVNYQKLSIVALAAIDKLHDRVVELEKKLHD